jgi:hypothetical protein
MYNAQNAQKTIIELRDALGAVRATEEVHTELLELVMCRGMVDLSLAVEFINQLVKANEELEAKLAAEGPSLAPDPEK